ncbi:MAG TPA: hypothetical protein VFJ98_10405 [Mycobacteriales bacterium]|nr:hypothetical protein [Mycobacteriales bacterium]
MSTRRLVAVLARPPVASRTGGGVDAPAAPAAGLAPPGVDDAALALAMVEDVVDLVSGMREVEAALVLAPGFEAARDTVWPGMPVCEMSAGFTLVDALDALAELGADEGTVVAGDAPDLPPLLLGKLHSALTAAQVAVCPADGGGLVALAARLPVPAWLREAANQVDPDNEKILPALGRVAPRSALNVGSGWHRIRRPEDVVRLDPGLEGWEATRALLSSPAS